MVQYTSQEVDRRVRERFVTARNNPRKLTPKDVDKLGIIETEVIKLAIYIETYLPDTRHKSLALTTLEETLTWANKAIYIHGASAAAGEVGQ